MTATRFFSVKDFETLQHYKDRSPPWIKFYNAVLDDYAFTSLPDASRSHLLAIWLLASRTNNRVPYDSAWIGQAIKASSSVDLEALVEAGFLIVESTATNTSTAVAQVASKSLDQRRDRAEGETEQSRADARAISDDEVSKPLAKAKDLDDETAIALGAAALKILGKHDDPMWTFGEVYAWRQLARENGVDDARLTAIVETEIKRVTAGKPTKARSLKYFTPMITEAILLRIDPPLQRAAENLPPVEVPAEYRAAVDQLAKLIGPRAHTVAYSQGLGSWEEKTAFIEREIEFEQRGAQVGAA